MANFGMLNVMWKSGVIPGRLHWGGEGAVVFTQTQKSLLINKGHLSRPAESWG